MEDDVAECLAAGFNDHLTKPINIQKLKHIIQQYGRLQGSLPENET